MKMKRREILPWIDSTKIGDLNPLGSISIDLESQGFIPKWGKSLSMKLTYDSYITSFGYFTMGKWLQNIPIHSRVR